MSYDPFNEPEVEAAFTRLKEEIETRKTDYFLLQEKYTLLETISSDRRSEIERLKKKLGGSVEEAELYMGDSFMEVGRGIKLPEVVNITKLEEENTKLKAEIERLKEENKDFVYLTENLEETAQLLIKDKARVSIENRELKASVAEAREIIESAVLNHPEYYRCSACDTKQWLSNNKEEPK